MRAENAMKWAIVAMIGIAIACLCIGIAKGAEPTGSFTLETHANGDGTLTPTLTWSTSAQACVASGDAEWEGPKANTGTQTLSAKPTTQPRAFALICNTAGDSQALLAWVPPTQNTDGTELTNLAGYRVQYGRSADALTQLVELANPSLTAYVIDGLAPGSWFFGVRAYTAQGAESVLSNIVGKAARAGIEWSQQTGVQVPRPPVVSDPE